jgi:hypothetical protein
MTETPAPPSTASHPREPLAFALVLHPGPPVGGGPDDEVWRAVLVSAQGETHRFRSLAGLVRFLAAASVGPPPEGGLR